MNCKCSAVSTVYSGVRGEEIRLGLWDEQGATWTQSCPGQWAASAYYTVCVHKQPAVSITKTLEGTELGTGSEG